MRLLLAAALALPLFCQTPKPDATAELHAKALKLIEATGGRERFLANFPDMLEQANAAMRKQCPDCNPDFLKEWGKRIADRLKVDDFVNVAARAYEKRFSGDELSELVTIVSSQKTETPIKLSPELQKKMVEIQPALMGEIVGGCTEIGAKLGSDIEIELLKEHPEWSQKPKAEKL